MTMREAKEIYLNSDCSYFIMCTKFYSGYIQYRRLELPKEQEIIWKNEKLQMLNIEIQKTGDYRIFNRLYEIAAEFRDYDKLHLLFEALHYIKQPLKPADSISVAETILGRKDPRVRSGIIFWAFDINQRALAIVFMDAALEFLHFPNITGIELERRIRKGRRLSKKIIVELKLNFSNRYLNHYYDF